MKVTAHIVAIYSLLLQHLHVVSSQDLRAEGPSTSAARCGKAPDSVSAAVACVSGFFDFFVLLVYLSIFVNVAHRIAWAL